MTDTKKKAAVVASFIFIAVMLVLFAILIIVRDMKNKEIVPEVTTELSTEREETYIPVNRLSVETRIANTVIRVSLYRNYIYEEDTEEETEYPIVDVTDPDFVPKDGYNYIPSDIAEPAKEEGTVIVYYEVPAE